MPPANGPYDPRPESQQPVALPSAYAGGMGRPRPALHWQNPTVPLMEQVFEGDSPPDPGSPARRRGFWIAAVVLILGVMVAQQWREAREPKAPPSPVPTVEPIKTKNDKHPPLGSDMDAGDLTGRLMTKIAHGAKQMDPKFDPNQVSVHVDPAGQPDLPTAVKLVPAYTEIAGKEEGLKALDGLDVRIAADRSEAEKNGKKASVGRLDELAKDTGSLRRLYTSGSDVLSAEDKARIEQRLGWAGRLALTFDKPESAEHQEMVKNGGALMVMLLLLVIAALLAAVAGLGLFITALVLLAIGKIRPRMDKARLGGSLGVEILVVFLASFLGLKLVLTGMKQAAVAGWFGEAVKEDPGTYLTVFALCAQWLILPIVVLYPRWRGHPRDRVKRAFGWHNGSGVVKEVGAGILGYLAGLPLLVLALFLSLLLLTLQQWITSQVSDEEVKAPVNAVGEMLTESWWMGLLVMALATVWAPIVEESVFRGGMFRQLFSRMGVVWAALISGTVFAIMHPYPPALFPPLIALGSWFALMRWWRGSLVSSITAHALHNGMITVLTVVMFSLMK